jgi:hypothetical protein
MPAPIVLGQADIYDGRPTFAEGTDLAYYVWHEGKTWKVRWTTMGRIRHFTGSVLAEGGKLKSLKRIDVETERRVVYPGRQPQIVYGPYGRPHAVGGRAPVVEEKKQDKIEKEGDSTIVFSAITRNDIDGFDFNIDDNVKTLRFVLEIDGAPRPHNLVVGKENQKPNSLPLVVTF